MNQFVILLFIIFILAILDAFAIGSLKQFHISRKTFYFLFSIIVYIIICYFLVYAFNFEQIAIVNALWNAMSIILIAIVGYIFFKEKITWNDMMAIVLVIIACILVGIYP